MKKTCMFVFLASFVALMVSGQPAFAKVKISHWHVVTPHSDVDRHPDLTPPAAGFYAAGAFFVTTGLNQAAISTAEASAAGIYSTPGNPWNGPWPGTNYPVGSSPDLWPCFGADSAQPGCAEIGTGPGGGNGSGSYPGEVVQGGPSYTWYLSANTATDQPYGCKATATADEFHFCAQANNYYEDDSNDSTDELLWSMTVKQGTNYIYDSGTVDYGSNAYGAIQGETGVAPNIVFYEDLNFGLMDTGSDTNGTYPAGNIGPCFANSNYPVANAPNGYAYGEYNTFAGLWQIAGGKTCVAPTPGVAAVSIITELESIGFTFETNSTAKPTTCPEPNDTAHVTVSGTDISWVSGTQFSNYTAGGTITVGTKTYTISSVNSATDMTITTSGTAATNAAATLWGNCFDVKYTALSPKISLTQAFNIYLE